jgi:hypothetical protein
MLHLVRARFVDDEPDDVDAHLVEQHTMRDQPQRGQPPQPGALGTRDRLQRRAVPGAGPGLHLAHDEHLTFRGHDVDLSDGAAPVPVEDPQPGPLQVFRGGLLSAPA